ncbi:MAG: restriction endonuclease subunit S [Deltaproteobacteria bacterium]|jgi:type I restriction enzyme S subunit|nr:restriction endonuclease subunit S [Deltaproteobacteria bacterium]
MNNWEEYIFSDFVSINPSVNLSKNIKYSFVEMKDLDSNSKFCHPSTVRLLCGGSRFEEGDTLFARITPCLENGKICQVKNLINRVGFGSTEFLVFRGINNISCTDFIYYLARSSDIRSFATSHMEGTSGRQRVPKECFDDLKLYLPPFQEQKAIASVLSSLDDKIDLLHRQNKTLEAMADTIFRYYFIENPNPDWQQKSLTSVAHFLNGLACQKFPPKNNYDKLPVLKIKELNNGIKNDSDYASNSVNDIYIVKNGDIIFSWSGSLIIKIWFGENCILNQHLYKVTSLFYHPWFYFQWCKYYLQDFIAIADSKATTMGHIKRSDLDKAQVIIPDTNTLKLFNSFFDPLIDRIIMNNKQINYLSYLRNLLLPKLMLGEVRVVF